MYIKNDDYMEHINYHYYGQNEQEFFIMIYLFLMFIILLFVILYYCNNYQIIVK